MADDTQLFINNWSTTISDATIAVDATTINIPSADSAILGAIAANEYFAATLSDGSNLEVIWITANDESGALTVIRAKEGTSGLSYTSGDTIEIRNTKGTYGNFVQRDAADTLTQKTLTSPVLNTGISGTAVKDEDNMASDSNTHLATQQSIKAYADSLVGAPEAHKDSHDPENGSDALDTAAASEIAGVQAAAEGTSHSLARADHAHQIQHGITDNHVVTIDQADFANEEFVRGTAAGIESRSNAEVKAQLTYLQAGDANNMADALLTRPEIKDYGESVNALGDLGGGSDAIDIELGNVVTATVSTAEQTFTFTNPSASGTACSFTLILTNGGSQTVNWPAAVDWAGGTAPTLTTAGVDVLTFTTVDAGTTWYGFATGLDMQ